MTTETIHPLNRNVPEPQRTGWMRRAMRLGAMALALAIALIPSAPARAQGDMDEAFDMGMEALSSRGCDKYCQILRLDDDQKDATRMLFDGYVEGVRGVGKEMSSYMNGLQDKLAGGDFASYQKEMGAKMKDYQERMQKIQDGFFDDLKSLLKDDQAERWPNLERYRRREELMQIGMVSGSGVDLIAIADRLKINQEADAALAEQFERYELDVDKPLLALKQTTKEMQDKQMDGMANFDPANPGAMMEQVEKMMEGLKAQARQVRDVNRQYERLILPLLPAEQAGKFADDFNFRSFPQVYRKSHAAKALAAAEKFSDLTDEQKQNLANVRQAYERDAAPANEKWAAEVERKEDSVGFMGMYMEGMGGGDPNDPVTVARTARRELDDQTRERIIAILTEDQRSRLPEKGPTDDSPWAGFQAIQEEEGEDPGQ